MKKIWDIIILLSWTYYDAIEYIKDFINNIPFRIKKWYYRGESVEDTIRRKMKR